MNTANNLRVLYSSGVQVIGYIGYKYVARSRFVTNENQTLIIA